LVADGIANGLLRFSTFERRSRLAGRLRVLVPADAQGEDGHADLSYIVAAAGEIARISGAARSSSTSRQSR